MRPVEHRQESTFGAPGAGTGRARRLGRALPLLVVALLAVAAGGSAGQAVPRSEATLERAGGWRARPTGSITAGSVEVYHWSGGEALAASILEPPGVLEPLPGLPVDALEVGPPIRVYLAPDAERFRRLTGGRAPEWGAGVALPQSGVVVLPGYGSARGATGNLPRVLRHELAHVVLYRHVAPARVPRWFSEGYATWAAGQLDPEAGWILRLAFLAGSAPQLDSLTIAWPAGQVDARIAYLLSASVLAYLHDRGGDRVLGIFLAEWKASGELDDALRGTYGLTLGQLERHWSRDVRRRYGWLVFLAQTTVIWSIVAILVIVLSAARRRRDRARLERLREQDRRETEVLQGLYETSVDW